MDGRTYLLLLDVNRHGEPEHLVLYSQSSGHLDRLVASHEPDPFAPTTDTTRWLQGVLRAHAASPPMR